ncbi:hypothetical protein J6TS2_05540 [Heyndrickxia sporothermodurans]|nr:hypothetical protein J6TS2_05540 [Heyndrickxia sporothermodurans]
MLIKVNKQDFDLRTNHDLSQRCFEPLVNIYKNQASQEMNLSLSQIKERFYEQLTEGMFYAYYNHVSQSLIEFYWWSAFFKAQPKSWLALLAGIRYFNDDSMVLLLKETEQVLLQHNLPETLENFTITRGELHQNKKLQVSLETLYKKFHDISPTTINKMNDFIKINIREFVDIED